MKRWFVTHRSQGEGALFVMGTTWGSARAAQEAVGGGFVDRGLYCEFRKKDQVRRQADLAVAGLSDFSRL